MRNSSNWDIGQTAVNKLIFDFKYDDQGKLSTKKVPGASVLYVIYDPLDRPVLLQDGNLRTANKWNYIKYDVQGRAISQGIYTDAVHTSQSSMQAYVNTLDYSGTYYEERSSGLAGGYYTNTVFPSSNIEPLAYSYFDDYDFNQDGNPDYSYQVQNLQDEASATSLTRGMLTGTRKRTIGQGLGNVWLLNVSFYDKKGNQIQVRSNNQLNAVVADSRTIVPDFTGKTQQVQTLKTTSATISVRSTFTYDHSDRLLSIDESYNGAASQRIAMYEYNEIGQLVKRNIHSLNTPGAVVQDLDLAAGDIVQAGQQKAVTASRSITLSPGFEAQSGSVFSAKIISASGYLQSVDYRYNIRGAMTSINNSTLSTDSRNNDTDDLFGMELLYNETDNAMGNQAYYNGQISAVKWMTQKPMNPALRERSYRFDYDKPGRLKNALYSERLQGAAWGNNGAFDEKGISYDQNGNILGLQRNALLSGSITAIDALSYSYDGNRLDNVADGSGGSYGLAGFKNLTGSVAAYGYDANGNISVDPKKGITNSFNEINRIGQTIVTTATGRYINYSYDAGGMLLRKQVYENNSLVKTTDYIDGFVYENSTLSYFSIAEGRVRNTNGTLVPEYMITDHQGNVRISFEEQGGHAVVRQENSYYPFGLIMPGGSLPSQPNRNLYNAGSEWQNDFSDLPDYYNTFFRNYDAALGRFISVDPMAAFGYVEPLSVRGQ